MSARARTKGAGGEREIIQPIFDNLGYQLKRNLDQTRSGGADLICDDPSFPFAIEVKRRRDGWTHAPAWWEQVEEACAGTRMLPVLIYRFDRRPWRCVMRVNTVSFALGGTLDHPAQLTCTIDLDTFYYVAREFISARAA